MEGYSNGTLGSSIKVHYYGQLESSMEDYNNGSLGSSITANYNG
jgi:hypothetical protein